MVIFMLYNRIEFVPNTKREGGNVNVNVWILAQSKSRHETPSIRSKMKYIAHNVRLKSIWMPWKIEKNEIEIKRKRSNNNKKKKQNNDRNHWKPWALPVNLSLLLSCFVGKSCLYHPIVFFVVPPISLRLSKSIVLNGKFWSPQLK